MEELAALYPDGEVDSKMQGCITFFKMLKECEVAVVNLSEDIHPLTEFKRNTTGLVRKMKRTKRPVVLTVNGKAELVVQDASSYQNMLERLDRLEAVEAIREGLKDVEEGRIQNAREALEALRTKLGLRR